MTALSQEPDGGLAAGRPAGTAGQAEVESRAAERVTTFSDAVVAIAITLLALALPVPGGGAHGLTDGQFLSALRGYWPDYLAFLISFAVIGSHWSSHRGITRYAVRLNGTFSRLNMIWLLMVVLIPFAARVLSTQGGSGARFAVYAVIQTAASMCLLLMTRECVRGNLLRADAPEAARHPDYAPYLAICIVFLLSIPVAFATTAAWPYLLWFSSPLVTWVLRRITGRRRHVTGAHGQPTAKGRAT